jgi:membrane protein EpsK
MTNNESKKRLVVNVVSNIAAVIAGALYGIWVTPYLIKNLGVEVYGMVPLIINIMAYLGIITTAITSSISRFVAISMSSDDYQSSNIYFNTSILTLLGLLAVLSIPFAIIIYSLNNLIQIPNGELLNSQILFAFIVTSTFIVTIASPLSVSTFVLHRFDLKNFAEIISRIFQVFLLMFCFNVFKPNIIYVGFSYLAANLLLLFLSLIFNKILAPDLKFNIKLFRLSAFKNLVNMGGWLAVDQIGTLLLLNADLIILNIFLGPQATGRYAPLLQWVLLLRLLSYAISGVFSPIAYEYIAKKQLDILAKQTKKVIKLLSLIMALPIGLLCGFSKELLVLWLGESFGSLWLLAVILIIPQIIFTSVVPIYSINRGLNTVKWPALSTLICGIINILVGITLIKITSMGIYAVALASIISMSIRSLLFTPIYTAITLNKKFTLFLGSLSLGVLITLVFALISYISVKLFAIHNFVNMVISAMVLIFLYIAITYYLVLNKDERSFVTEIIRKQSIHHG